MVNDPNADVLIIGAGPAGALAGTLLAQSGLSVSIFEHSQFPRFSIGESLLPQSMVYLDEAGLLPLLQRQGFQKKNGAAFQRGLESSVINFQKKSSLGPHETYEVQRASFDHLLAQYAEQEGAHIFYQHQVTSFKEKDGIVQLGGIDERGSPFQAQGKFVLDASGYGRVLSKLLDLEIPSTFPHRKAVFSHITDHITDSSFDRNKILITIHHNNPNIWYWLIPFSDGTSSLGAVGLSDDINEYGQTDEERLRGLIAEDPYYQDLLPHYAFVRPAGAMQGYSTRVKSLHGPGFALLGNAAEFLDPIFSSGVTIALKSASLAAKVLPPFLEGKSIDWQTDYANPLTRGVETFRTFVESWYEGTLQDIIMNNPDLDSDLGQMIVSVLAGYAWDETNAFVKKGRRLLPLIKEGLV